VFDEPLKAAIKARQVPAVKVTGIGFSTIPETEFEAEKIAMGATLERVDSVVEMPAIQADHKAVGRAVWEALASPLVNVVKVERTMMEEDRL
jgi:hypothetical protein